LKAKSDHLKLKEKSDENNKLQLAATKARDEYDAAMASQQKILDDLEQQNDILREQKSFLRTLRDENQDLRKTMKETTQQLTKGKHQVIQEAGELEQRLQKRLVEIANVIQHKTNKQN
jgi:CTP-dependent riboflavin kinase